MTAEEARKRRYSKEDEKEDTRILLIFLFWITLIRFTTILVM